MIRTWRAGRGFFLRKRQGKFPQVIIPPTSHHPDPWRHRTTAPKYGVDLPHARTSCARTRAVLLYGMRLLWHGDAGGRLNLTGWSLAIGICLCDRPYQGGEHRTKAGAGYLDGKREKKTNSLMICRPARAA